MNRRRRFEVFVLAILAVGLLGAAAWPGAGTTILGIGQAETKTEPGHAKVMTLFDPLFSKSYSTWERVALLANVGVAIAGLIYALSLVRQVKNAPQGTTKMQEIAA